MPCVTATGFTRSLLASACPTMSAVDCSAPNSEGQLRAMRAAYAEAGWQPEDVDLIECHATGTAVGDAVEFQSLRSLWEGNAGRCILGSVKATVGHLLTAAGAAGLTKVLMVLRTATLPPTANFARPAPGIDMEESPFRVLSKAAPWERRQDRPSRAAISAFGFGGINAHLLLEEWIDTAGPGSVPSASAEAGDIAVIALDARVGPWSSLRAVQERLFGFDDTPPTPPRRWWGIEPERLRDTRSRK